jgi:nucleoside-diphosphate-sugar epimerase
MSRILVTGGTGFVGSFVAPRLAALGHDVVLAGRNAPPGIPGLPFIHVGEQSPATDWRAALAGAEVVLHLAGKAHAPANSRGVREEIHRVNVLGTEALARQAAGVVRRLVFLSSVKVYGEEAATEPLRTDMALRPVDAYGESKARAEDALNSVSAATGLEVACIRPPLMLGPRAKGNLAQLARVIARGIPLPIAGIRNHRSLLSLENLLDLCVLSLEHPGALAAPLLAADGEPTSTPDLATWIAEGLGKPARIWSLPANWLEVAGSAVGRGSMARRLTRSLLLDSSRTRELTGWQPRVSSAMTIRACAPSWLQG